MVELMTDIRALEKSLNEFVHEQSNRSKQMETLLLEAHQELLARKEQIPGFYTSVIDKTAQRLANLYDAWGKSTEASRWRQIASPAPAKR